MAAFNFNFYGHDDEHGIMVMSDSLGRDRRSARQTQGH